MEIQWDRLTLSQAHPEELATLGLDPRRRKRRHANGTSWTSLRPRPTTPSSLRSPRHCPQRPYGPSRPIPWWPTPDRNSCNIKTLDLSTACGMAQRRRRVVVSNVLEVSKVCRGPRKSVKSWGMSKARFMTLEDEFMTPTAQPLELLGTDYASANTSTLRSHCPSGSSQNSRRWTISRCQLEFYQTSGGT